MVVSDTQREIAKISEDRIQAYQQVEILRQEEYDCLKAMQISSISNYEAQLADLKAVGNKTALNEIL